MASAGEIDPTEPGRDDAGAEGGAVGGDSDGDSTLPPPLQPPQDIDRTNPFQPHGSSTPYLHDIDEEIELSNMNLDSDEEIELSNMDLDKVNLSPDYYKLLADRINSDDQQMAIDDTNRLIQDKFPQANFSRIDPLGFGKKPENRGKIVSFGKGKDGKYGETRVLKKDGSGFLKGFTDKFKKALGPSAEMIIAEDNTALQDAKRRIAEAQVLEDHLNKQAERQQQEVQERQRLETQLEQINQRIDNMENEGGTMMERQMELDRLRRESAKLERDIEAAKAKTKQFAQIAKQKDKAEREVARLKRQYDDRKKKRDATEAGLNRTKPLDTLEVEEETFKRKIEEDQQILNDENVSSEERNAAYERYAVNVNELARLESQVQEREQELPLRERVKRIFKKYGWTLQAVALAVGIVLSALALAATNGLKAGTKAIGNGLKAIGQKFGSLLPGLIGSIVSYIFKAAGQVFSFLGEHAWLLILAVVAFFMERLLKKRKSK